MTRRARLGARGSAAAVAALFFGVVIASPVASAAEPDKKPAAAGDTDKKPADGAKKPADGTKKPADGAPAGNKPLIRRPDVGGKPAAAPPPAAEGPKIDAPRGGLSEEEYDIKVRQLEEKVTGLKEKIFRTKTRLLLLREQVLNDVIAEAKAVIHHVNDMGSDFKLEQVFYQLDGEKIYYQDNADGQLNKAEKIELFAGNVLPGNHVLSVEMRYRGDSTVFGYLNDYVFRLRANFTFYATKGKVTKVKAVGFLRGDVTYDLTQRPYIKFETSQESYTKGKQDKNAKGEKK